MRPTTAAIALTADDRVTKIRYPAATVPEGFGELIPYALVADLELHDEMGRPQLRPVRDRRGRVTGVAVDPQPLTDADTKELRRRRIRERVDPADVAMALTGDAEAQERLRQVVSDA